MFYGTVCDLFWIKVKVSPKNWVHEGIKEALKKALIEGSLMHNGTILFSRVSTSIHLSIFECLRACLDPSRQKGLGAPQRSTCNKMNKTLLNRTSSQNFKSLIAKGLNKTKPRLLHFWTTSGLWGPDLKWNGLRV